MSRPTPRRPYGTAVVLACTFLACGTPDARSTGRDVAASADAPLLASPPRSAPAPAAERATAVDQAAAPGAGAALPPTAATAATTATADSAAVSMIIRTGRASVEVDSLEPAVAALRALAASVGGFVANSSMQAGRDEPRSASLELKIPAPRYERAVAGLRPLGRVESVNDAAEDVGEEFVDVTARTANARRLESRLVDLLARRTGKLEDVLAVERELARVREEIERYDGRIRYLRARAALSTLTVTVHEPVAVIARAEGRNPLAAAVRDAWRNFVGFLAAFISSLGVLVPLGTLAALAWWAVRRFRRPPPPSRATGAGDATTRTGRTIIE